MKKRNLFIIALSMLLGVSTSSCVRNKIETITPSPTEIDEEPTHYGVNPKTFDSLYTRVFPKDKIITFYGLTEHRFLISVFSTKSRHLLALWADENPIPEKKSFEAEEGKVIEHPFMKAELHDFILTKEGFIARLYFFYKSEVAAAPFIYEKKVFMKHDITQILTETHQGMPDANSLAFKPWFADSFVFDDACYTETGCLLYTRIIPHYAGYKRGIATPCSYEEGILELPKALIRYNFKTGKEIWRKNITSL